jgi:hypothetical protein
MTALIYFNTTHGQFAFILILEFKGLVPTLYWVVCETNTCMYNNPINQRIFWEIVAFD